MMVKNALEKNRFEIPPPSVIRITSRISKYFFGTLFTIIFRPKMICLDTDSILRIKIMYESVKYKVNQRFSFISGYRVDPFLKELCSDPKIKSRRSPAINRGYLARLLALEVTFEKFLSIPGKFKQVLSLGKDL